MSSVVEALAQRPFGDLVDGLRRLGRSPAWLFAAADPEAVEAALTRQVHEFASGELTLRQCQVGKVRVDHGSVTAVYRLTVEGQEATRSRVLEFSGEILPPGSGTPEIGSQSGPIGSDEWRCYVPELRLALRAKPADAALAILPVLTDPGAARALLERGIRAGSRAYADFRIETCTPHVARYKPGSRCTVIYDLEFRPEDAGRGWPNRVVAKTHVGAEGRNAYEGMRALWSSKLRNGSAVTIAEPLAYLPDENVMLQGPVPGELTLKKLIATSLRTDGPEKLEELSRYIGKIGVGLAALHTCGVTDGEHVTWADEIPEIRARIERIAELEPDVGAATGSLLRHLEVLATEHPADRAVPAHRSFRPAQVLLAGGAIGFIDFDGFCQAEPALDLGLFRAMLKDLGLRALSGDGGAAGGNARAEHIARVARLCEVFTERYQATAPVSRMRVALWEAFFLLGLVVNCWSKVKPEKLEHRLQLLSHHLQTTGLE